MQYGFIIPTGDVRTIAELAHEAEDAGWDGVFYWDGICIGEMGPMYDPWVTMAAMAMRTERVKLGAMLTPLSRRRPWKVARETVTLDHLSQGRLIVPVGLGAVDDGGFSKVNEITDRKTRAERLDESLDILTGLWSGEPFSYTGKHYQVQEMTFLPPPVQTPRIPIWVAGGWPSERSMRRVLRYDGLLPNKLGENGASGAILPEDLRAMRDYIAAHRTATTPFAIVMEGVTPGDDPVAAVAKVQPYLDAGATWWLEAHWSAPNGPEDSRHRIRQGPPRAG
jgi:alkanesulfonate monooxygenase SsuD/methylene tetrahydromethanopterin reductase-like flavin-dependent oxidoreductase (luciferase family)